MTYGLTPDDIALHLDPLAYLIGLEGVALLRAFAGEHGASFVEERLAEIERLLGEREQLGQPMKVPLLSAADGYDAWSATYDDPGNALLGPDLARVTSMIEGHRGGGVALDAACGTGRYAEWLLGQGYEVVGVDASPGMLKVARQKLPDADFRDGHLGDLPVATGSADLAVCALALTHVLDLTRPYQELARVLKPGGRLVVSDTHSLYLTSTRYPLVRQLPKTAERRLRLHPRLGALLGRSRQCRPAGRVPRHCGRGAQDRRDLRPVLGAGSPSGRSRTRPLAAHDLGEHRRKRGLLGHTQGDVPSAAHECVTRHMRSRVAPPNVRLWPLIGREDVGVEDRIRPAPRGGETGWPRHRLGSRAHALRLGLGAVSRT